MSSRVCHVDHPSNVTTSSASDPIVRERLSAGSALSTSDNRQGLSGKQSVQGEPAKTYRPLHDSLDADIHSSPSPSRHISRLSAVLSRCFLTATRKKRHLMRAVNRKDTSASRSLHSDLPSASRMLALHPVALP
jgi:hypothetical protein